MNSEFNNSAATAISSSSNTSIKASSTTPPLAPTSATTNTTTNIAGASNISSFSTTRDNTGKSPSPTNITTASPTTGASPTTANYNNPSGGGGGNSNQITNFLDFNFNEAQSIFGKQQRNVQRRHVQDLELRFTKQIFQEFDEDGSDSIDLEELRKVMEAMGHEMTDTQLSELLEQVDVNRSGDLSFSEFVQLIALWKAASQFKLFESDAPSIQDQRIADALEPELGMSDNWTRMAWDALVYIMILYSFLLISYILTTINLDDKGITDVLVGNTFEIDIVATVILGLDIILGFFSAQRISPSPTDRRVLDSLPKVAHYHLTSVYFYVDVLSLLPLHRFSSDKQFLWLGFNTVFRILKVPRLFQRSQRMQLSATYVYVHFYLVPLTHAVVGAIMFVHLLSCFWTLVQRAAVSEGAPLVSKDQLAKATASVNTTSVNYVSSLYFILATITTTGFGDIYIIEHSGRIVAACILCVVGTLTTGIVIGNIVSTLSKTNIQTDRENKLVQTLAVLNYFSVPQALANEILNFQNHLLLHNIGDSHRDLIRGLPTEMQLNISLFSRINLVSECELLFGDAHQGTKVAIAELVSPEVFRPDENVIMEDTLGDCMYFISYGVLGTKELGKQDRFFQRGNYFGELALLCPGAKRRTTIRALTYCDLFKLTPDVFRSILARFPKFRMSILAVSEKRKQHLIDNHRKEGDLVKMKEVMEMKFIHEEEGNQMATTTTGSASASSACVVVPENTTTTGSNQQQQESSTSQLNDTNTNVSTGDDNQQQQQSNQNTTTTTTATTNVVPSDSSANENNENQNTTTTTTTDENKTQEKTGVSGGSRENSNTPNARGGENQTPDNDVRTNIKTCSTTLTELHSMIHAMTHGFQIGGGIISGSSVGVASTSSFPSNLSAAGGSGGGGGSDRGHTPINPSPATVGVAPSSSSSQQQIE